MSPQRRGRHLVVWSSSVGPADRYGTSAAVRTRRKGRVRRLVRITGLLAVISLMGAFRVARSRRRLLAGLVLAALTVILRDSMWGVLFFLAFLLYLPPWSPQTA
jgi:nitric oxide reductase large subunit